MQRVVYDCLDTSPHYASQDYLRKEDQIDAGAKVNKFYKNLAPYYPLTGPEDDTLVFESRFECGNL